MLDLDSGRICGSVVTHIQVGAMHDWHRLRLAHTAPSFCCLLATSTVARQDEGPCIHKLTAPQQGLEVAGGLGCALPMPRDCVSCPCATGCLLRTL